MAAHKKFFQMLFILPVLLHAQVEEQDELFLKLKKMDSLLFEAGFNQCKLQVLKDFVADDLEFYHDQGGVSTTKAVFLQDVQLNICSTPDKKPIRKLKAGSLQVFPLYDGGVLYGAIQKGEHDFFLKEPGKKLYPTSSAYFTHVWLLKDQNWILKRVLSYAHKPVR